MVRNQENGFCKRTPVVALTANAMSGAEEKYRKMGFGGSVVRKMIDYSREVIHLHQLYVVIDSNNTSCIDLFKNYGFKESHCLEDWLYDGEKYRKAVFLTLFL